MAGIRRQFMHQNCTSDDKMRGKIVERLSWGQTPTFLFQFGLVIVQAERQSTGIGSRRVGVVGNLKQKRLSKKSPKRMVEN
jgi:hypothetical protein